MALKFVLNPQIADISGKDHIGFDTRATSLIPGGTLTPTVVNSEPVEFLFYHDGNTTFYFGEGNNPLSDYGFGQESMTLTLQRYGAVAMDFTAGNTPNEGYWSLVGAPTTLKDFLIANVGNDINITIDAEPLKPSQPDLTELRNKQNTWFQKQNHTRPAKNQVSKKYIDPALGTSSGNVGPPPVAVNLTAHFDFSNPSNYETLNDDGVNVIVGTNLAGGFDFGRDTLTNCGQIIAGASPSGLDAIHSPSSGWGVGGLGQADNYPNTLPTGQDMPNCAYHISTFKMISSSDYGTAIVGGTRSMSYWDLAGVGDGSISVNTYGTSLALNGEPLRGDPTGYIAATYENSWVVQESVPAAPNTNGIISKQPTGTRPPIGHWGEFLMYDAVPSEADRQALVQYLTDKWGITPVVVLTGETAGFVIETPTSTDNSQFIDPDGPGGDQLEIEGESPSYFGTAADNELVCSFGSDVTWTKMWVQFGDKTPVIEMTEIAPGNFLAKIPNIQDIMAQLRGTKQQIKYLVA